MLLVQGVVLMYRWAAGGPKAWSKGVFWGGKVYQICLSNLLGSLRLEWLNDVDIRLEICWVQCMLQHVSRSLVVDIKIREDMCLHYSECLRVHTRDNGERIVEVERVVETLSRSYVCCMQSCTLPRYVLVWQWCEPPGVWSRSLPGCCLRNSTCSSHGCVGCHIKSSNPLLEVFWRGIKHLDCE